MSTLLGPDIERVFLTGGAGFIGSHVVDLLLPQGVHVTALDNLSNGRRAFIEPHLDHPRFEFVEGDMADFDTVVEAMQGHDLVWHLAANTDIIGGHAQPRRDLRDCVEATFNAVEAMRLNRIQPILFSSTGAVYGDLCREVGRDETAGPLLPMSCYAAGKISSEAFISAYAHLYDLRAWMFRFGNVLGARMTHGVIYDFIHKLQNDPTTLEILGDGTQEKNYFLVEECIEGMAYAFRNIPMTADAPCDLFNLGTDSITRVTDIARIVVEEMELPDVDITIQGTPRAWPGDQPKVHITVDKIQSHGWKTRRTSDDAVREAVRRMLKKSPALPPDAGRVAEGAAS